MTKKISMICSGILLLALCSCKKDYTCECTTTSSSTTTNSNGVPTTVTQEPQTTTTVYKGVRKSDIKTICGNSNSKYHSENTSGISTSIYETKCEIK